MSEITFFATDDDCAILWSIIFDELGMTAYPDRWFGEMPARPLTTRSDVAFHLNQYPKVAPGLSYFLTSKEWSQEALEYGLCENNPNFLPHWYVKQRYGGPSIHFIPRFGYPYPKKARQLISGMFVDYPYYYSATNHRHIIERPVGLVSSMKAIRQHLRIHGSIVRSNTGKRAIAMSNALSAGMVLRTGDIVYSQISSGLANKTNPPPNKRLERTRR